MRRGKVFFVCPNDPNIKFQTPHFLSIWNHPTVSPITRPPSRTLVTAFGPFDGRPQNASGLALQQLRKCLPGLRSRTFPVDSVIAPARLRQALRLLRPDLLLLLGEAAGSKTIRLEQSAWNELDFRIPDIAGRQPRNRPIDPRGPAVHHTPLPVDALHDHLADAGFPVSLSSNPGRYLCNQLYYLAAGQVPRTLFIHLPLAADLTTDDATSAVIAALDFFTRESPGSAAGRARTGAGNPPRSAPAAS